MNVEPDIIPPNFERKIVEEIRKAVVRGILLYNLPVGDDSNDRHLEVYTYIRLGDVDPSLIGVAKLRVMCRLSAMTGALSLRTIEKRFKVE